MLHLPKASCFVGLTDQETRTGLEAKYKAWLLRKSANSNMAVKKEQDLENE